VRDLVDDLSQPRGRRLPPRHEEGPAYSPDGAPPHADVLVARTDDDVTAHLHPDHFQALALEQVPAEHRVNPNTGVWLMRSCPSAFDFLDAVEAAGTQPGPWADQGAVLAALGWNRGDERYHWSGPGPGTRFLAGTSWLPSGWNQPYLEGRTAENCYNGSAASYVGRRRCWTRSPSTSWA
jgi:hypothetical protein